MSGSALTNGPVELAGVPGSADRRVTAPPRERGNWLRGSGVGWEGIAQ